MKSFFWQLWQHPEPKFDCIRSIMMFLNYSSTQTHLGAGGTGKFIFINFMSIADRPETMIFLFCQYPARSGGAGTTPPAHDNNRAAGEPAGVRAPENRA